VTDRIHVIPATSRENVEIVRGLFMEYASSLGLDLEYQGFSVELQTLPGAYQPPSGGLFLAWVNDSPAGCVAIRLLRAQICEMKRLYVRPAHRRAGLGPLLVQTAIDAARGYGYEEMWLDTLPTMVAAQRLHLRLGFREIPPYGSAAAPGTRFYGVRLVA
jgi:GNAT superfamily N-acetyltransferase